MPRTGHIKKKILPPDPVYGSQLVTRLIHRVMRDGKKTIAEKHVYSAFDFIQEKHKKDPLKTFQQALENVKPAMEVRPRRVGGAAYQVPLPVRGDRKESLGIRWLVSAARSRPNKEYHHFWEKLAAEILAASEKTGRAVQRREEIQRVADANKAFAHFRW